MTILKPKENGKAWLVYETDEGICIERDAACHHVTHAPNTRLDYLMLCEILSKVPK